MDRPRKSTVSRKVKKSRKSLRLSKKSKKPKKVLQKLRKSPQMASRKSRRVSRKSRRVSRRSLKSLKSLKSLTKIRNIYCSKEHLALPEWLEISKKYHSAPNNTHWHDLKHKRKHPKYLAPNAILMPSDPFSLLIYLFNTEMNHKCISDLVVGVLSYQTDSGVTSYLKNHQITKDGIFFPCITNNTDSDYWKINPNCCHLINFANIGIVVKVYGKLEQAINEKTVTQMWDKYYAKNFIYKTSQTGYGQRSNSNKVNETKLIKDIEQKKIPDNFIVLFINPTSIFFNEFHDYEDISDMTNKSINNYEYKKDEKSNWNIIELSG